ncbi:hypothetical protein [Flavobacterium sp.]|uniref:hypothetical protein n=1 Tax=Flavobacterium sp. TaxID=239 RepID=UPI0039E4D041
MKSNLIVFLLFLSQIMIAQCRCDSLPDLQELLSCKPTLFKNGAKIYRQYDCDSSWLVFENPQKVKRLLTSEYGGDLYLAGRIGFVDWTEYNSTFLMIESTVSGCCQPPNGILFDKNTGTRKKDLGPIVYQTEHMDYPFVVTLDNGNLQFLHLDSGKTFRVKLPRNRIANTLRYAAVIFPERLFIESKLENGVVTLIYGYQTSEKEEDWQHDQVIVDLKKHLK